MAVGSASIDFVPRWLKESRSTRSAPPTSSCSCLVVAAVVGGLAIAVGTASLRRPRVGYASLVLLADDRGGGGPHPTERRVDRCAPRVDGSGGRSGHVAAAAAPSSSGQAEPGEGATVADPGSGLEAPIPAWRARSRSAPRQWPGSQGSSCRGAPRRWLLAPGSSVPTEVAAAPPVPSGADLGIEGMTPFITPNADFYRIDTALIVPTVIAEEWRPARPRHGRARAHAGLRSADGAAR